MGKIIKVWEYKNYASSVRFELRADAAYEFTDGRLTTHTFGEMLTGNFIRNDLETTTEILQCLGGFLSGGAMSETAQKHLLFWKSYRPKQEFKGFTLRHNAVPGNTVSYFTEFGPWGMREKTVLSDGSSYCSNFQRIDRLYFYGPLTHSLGIEVRRNVKEEIYRALGFQKDLDPDSCSFVMFDYNKIIDKKWEIHHSDYQFDEMQLKKGYVIIAGRDGRDSGSVLHSPEQIWYSHKVLIPSSLDHYSNELLDILKQSIIV